MKRFLRADSQLPSDSTSDVRGRLVETPRPSDFEAGKVSLWRRHTTIAAAMTVVLVVVAAACGSAPAATEPAAPEGSGEGAVLYQSNCASCHGADLRGTDKGPSHLSIVYEPNHHGDDAFRSAIANGAQQHHWNFGDMAAIPGLADDEVDAIIGYIRSEQERQGFEQ